MKFIDLTGKTFGIILVISHSHCGKDSKHYWNCRCKCGKEKIIRGNYLTDGRVVSCGCLKTRKGKNHPGWKGVGDLSGEFIYNIRANAKHRKIPFRLSPEYMWALFTKQNGHCALSGIPISLEGNSSEIRYAKTTKRTASLDRIDSSKGYVEGNVQWVHKSLNVMKMEMGYHEFLDWCKLVVSHAPITCRHSS